jgi:uncharacterized protein YbjT (DUF2867 family)
MNTTAVVIGASGLVGSALVNKLVTAGHIDKVITLTRRSIIHPSTKVENHVVNFDRLEDASSLFKADFLFSCLGTTRAQAGSISAQRVVDLEYQFNAAQLAVQNGIPHYLLISSNGANAKSNNPYLKMKGELELRIQSLGFKRISIFQPSLLMGKRKELRVAEKIGGLLMPIFSFIPGLRRYRPIKGEQVAEKMLRVSQQSGEPLEYFRLDELFTN